MISVVYIIDVYVFSAGACLEDVNDCDMTLLDLALFFYQSDIISELFRGGYDCNQRFQLQHSLMYYSDHYSNSVLYSLIMNDDLLNTELLLKCGYGKRFREFHSLLRSSPVIQSYQQPGPVMCYLRHAVSHAFSLTDLTRITVRDALNTTRIHDGGCLYDLVEHLPLPARLKRFLCFDL